MRRDPNSFSIEERKAIVAAVHGGLKQGKRVAITAREHGITEALFYRWEREKANELNSTVPATPPQPKMPQVVARKYCNQEDRERLIPLI